MKRNPVAWMFTIALPSWSDAAGLARQITVEYGPPAGGDVRGEMAGRVVVVTSNDKVKLTSIRRLAKSYVTHGHFSAVRRWKQGVVDKTVTDENPRRSARGLKVSRGDLGAGFRCVSCNRKLGQLHGVNCRIGKKNPRRTTKRRNGQSLTDQMRKAAGGLHYCSEHGTQYRGARCPLPHKKQKRAKRNPLLGIFGANPRARVVRELGRVVEVRYKRKDDGRLYFHRYSSKPRLLALSDGSIWIKGA